MLAVIHLLGRWFCPAIRSPQVLAEDSQPLTILAVGDSITAGGGAGGGYYRHVLNELLKQSSELSGLSGLKWTS